MLVALVGYALTSRTRYDDLDGRLVSVTEHVAAELAGAKSQEDRDNVLAGARGFAIGVTLYDSTGSSLTGDAPSAHGPVAVNPRHLVAEPSRAPYNKLAALLPMVSPASTNHGFFGLGENGTNRWRAFVLPVDELLSGDGRVARYIVGTESLLDLDTSLRRTWRFLMVATVVGILVMAATVWLVAGRALRPVLLLTDAAGTIARSGAFSQRVPADRSRDELGQLAETFNVMLERLDRVHSAQARFVADASHELRAPLTVIQANLELLENQHALSPSAREEAVHEAHQESARLGRLVADLLALARADSGAPMRHDPVDFDRVVMDVLAEVRHLALRQRIKIAELDSVIVPGDADKLKQLVLNLIENAIRYTPADGLITVSLRRAGAFAVLEVRDEGIGISADDLPHVFERFFRADRARTRNVGGTGLGLSIAQWIAGQHDGEIILTSELGHGTLATVQLPMAT
jgi:two-component system OmpR family sensor kinase